MAVKKKEQERFFGKERAACNETEGGTKSARFMKLLITGICGFVGCSMAQQLLEIDSTLEIIGLDNLSRSGSEKNREVLRKKGISFLHGDLRNPTDLENLPFVDYVIDAAANPSVLSGVDGKTSARQVVEHNLFGTANLLEYCRKTSAGLILLSTSRVYSILELQRLPLQKKETRFELQSGDEKKGFSSAGISEDFSTKSPLSLYGSTKLASEILALEYAEAHDFPLWVNRCGVLAGAGQFGRADQGIFSYWLHLWHARQPLRYFGFSGEGLQVRDCLHPADLTRMVWLQMKETGREKKRVQNLSGGVANAISLRELSQWCEKKWGRREVSGEKRERQYDVPWLVLDSTQAQKEWNWKPEVSLPQILDEIARHAEENPDWLELTSA